MVAHLLYTYCVDKTKPISSRGHVPQEVFVHRISLEFGSMWTKLFLNTSSTKIEVSVSEPAFLKSNI